MLPFTATTQESARLVPMARVVPRIRFPLAGPKLAGTRPFTCPIPAQEWLELGLCELEVEGGEEEGNVDNSEGGLDDSGLGGEERQDLEAEGEKKECRLLPEEACEVIDDEEGGGGTVGQRGPAPTPH